jgi:hypothetical protein
MEQETPEVDRVVARMLDDVVAEPEASLPLSMPAVAFVAVLVVAVVLVLAAFVLLG